MILWGDGNHRPGDDKSKRMEGHKIWSCGTMRISARFSRIRDVKIPRGDELNSKTRPADLKGAKRSGCSADISGCDDDQMKPAAGRWTLVPSSGVSF